MFRISRNRSGVLSRELRRGVILTLLAVGSQSGCTREFYREWANQDVSEAVFEKSRDPRWRIDLFSIEPPALSRFADPYDPEFPPAPPDDQAAEALSPVPQWPDNRLIVPIEATTHLEMMEDWMTRARCGEGSGQDQHHDLRGTGQRAEGRNSSTVHTARAAANNVSIRAGRRFTAEPAGTCGSPARVMPTPAPLPGGPPGRRHRLGDTLAARRWRRAAGHGAVGQGFAEASRDEFRDNPQRFVANTLSEHSLRGEEDRASRLRGRLRVSSRGKRAEPRGSGTGRSSVPPGRRALPRVQPRRTGLASPCNRRKLDLARKG